MIIHFSISFIFFKAEWWIDWSMLVVHLTQMLDSSHLLSATIIQMVPPIHCFYIECSLINRLFMSFKIHYGVTVLTKPLSSRKTVGQHLFHILSPASVFMAMDEAGVIAWTIKVIKGWFGKLRKSIFLFFTICVAEVCLCVWIMNGMEGEVRTGQVRTGRGDRWHPHDLTLCKRASRSFIHKIYCHSTPLPISPFSSCPPPLPSLSFINKIESCFSEQEIRSRSHSTGRSNREMTGATGKGYLQLLFIYLFRRYLVPRLRKGRKAIFIFLMGLPSTDNVPVLFPFSWISHATKCAANAKRCLVLSTTQKGNYSPWETKLSYTRNHILEFNRLFSCMDHCCLDTILQYLNRLRM